MPLDTTLADITARLRKNGFPNKQAISQGIVLRVLSELGWDTYEPAVVWPEYQTRGGRADFALCHPPSKPAIFIEVKHVGGAEGAVQQALHYASHCSVPFVVLTDGRTWNFYLPAEQGDYDDRRVSRLDLYERAADEAAETFRCYLTQRNVTSGKALGSARTEYRNRKRRSQAKAAIPEAWRELVHKRDGRLLEILADAVESKIGFSTGCRRCSRVSRRCGCAKGRSGAGRHTIDTLSETSAGPGEGHRADAGTTRRTPPVSGREGEGRESTHDGAQQPRDPRHAVPRANRQGRDGYRSSQAG